MILSFGVLGMKLRSITVANMRSFLEPQTLALNGDISIIVGPNGGGKTNLLDCVTHILRHKLIPPYEGSINPTDGKFFISPTMHNPSRLEKNFANRDQEQTINIQVEVTNTDLKNIESISRDLPNWVAKHNLHNHHDLSNSLIWPSENLSAGQTVGFTIIDDEVAHSSSTIFRNYLKYFQLDRLMRKMEEQFPLTTPTLSLPVSRTSGDFQTVITLSQVDIPAMRQAVNGNAGPIAGPRGFVPLAIAQLSENLRNLVQIHGSHAFNEMRKDPNLVGFSSALRSLGYDWSIDCIDTKMNSYTLKLKKQGIEFNLANASSGEKELITFLLSIYVLNVKDALIIVDEPELHLHPRWQKALYGLFERLSADTGNQFLLATHSPTFISPSSAPYVSRVYSEQQKSRIIAIDPKILPTTKHQFEAINSQNNERMFFADLVVLVEGPSDRMFFEKLLELRSKGFTSGGATLEVISVGGKTMFEQYASILEAWKVRHVRIADLDYIQEIGTPELKALFKPDSKKILKTVVNASSKDGQMIIDMIDKTINTNTWEGDTKEWHRIKARRSKLTVSLSTKEQTSLETFTKSKASEGVYVLTRGALEAYLPEGYTSKDIDKLINLINADDFLKQLPSPNREELFDIVDSIESIRSLISDRTDDDIQKLYRS